MSVWLYMAVYLCHCWHCHPVCLCPPPILAQLFFPLSYPLLTFTLSVFYVCSGILGLSLLKKVTPHLLWKTMLSIKVKPSFKSFAARFLWVVRQVLIDLPVVLSGTKASSEALSSHVFQSRYGEHFTITASSQWVQGNAYTLMNIMFCCRHAWNHAIFLTQTSPCQAPRIMFRQPEWQGHSSPTKFWHTSVGKFPALYLVPPLGLPMCCYNIKNVGGLCGIVLKKVARMILFEQIFYFIYICPVWEKYICAMNDIH